ncbi:MAG: tetratricopeptide repeat protein [Candidatus Omnitrophica bacterium]|nr:tetratricopeptide repeat protein [Candidatus Omnitrophota bacterium]MCF7892234.1 tetratricopeptide repeat protein [Candidatus Omnitrophota bacterium]MCF7896101.1 tetratricopeptide repeat protein [Candidatus Omnitrophota bacterium]MCF7897784.1 tetratricopeptide repeat protein [Candidatus Omnitrophota bacterium]MCF7909190.1 tetratricopeptide repeat protein [Candidatus Omnitrophota bacterium]
MLAKRKNILIAGIIAFFLLVDSGVLAYDSAGLYQKVKENATQGDIYRSFMYLRQILREYPDSKFAKSALFSLGEFYFLTTNYQQAVHTLQKFINKYPDSKLNIFVLSFLYEISKENKSLSNAQEIRNKIITFYQHSFLFRESKTYSYTSALLKNYKVQYFIDTIKFFIDEKPSFEIKF